VGRLRDLPIWSKLGLIMIVPTIATIIVGTAGLVDNINRANVADRTRTLANLSADAGALVHELQDERAKSTILLGLSTDNSAASKAEYDKQAQLADVARKTYLQHRSALADIPATMRSQLGRIDTELSELDRLREQIKGSNEVSLSLAAFRYRVLIADLLGLRDSAAELAAGEVDLGGDMRAAASIANAKEFLSQERIVILRAFALKDTTHPNGSLPAELKRQFIGTVTGQDQALQQFNVVATADQKILYDQTVSGADLRDAVRFQGLVDSLPTDAIPAPAQFFDAAAWDKAMVGRAKLLRTVEQSLDSHIIRNATQQRDRLQRTVLVETGLLLGMLLLAILFAWAVARSMARSLRELRHGALTVAQYGLPQAVARLRDPTLSSQMSPQQVALQIAEPLPVRSRDEFGQVAEAFNAVHLEAVRTAAEQAALRASVATMFINLARRSQILVDRLIGHLDRLERGEEDPDRLAELFQLDHLATRMRRNDENLLVLAGADSTRVQREPAPLMDVLRAAQSEVEHYTRIEFGMIDRDVEIGSQAVNDMVHLVAELLDNATAFSPPDSAVVVEARRVGDRAVLLIEDRGIGVSPDQLQELNERLANPPMVDVAVSRMMGLVVVARLAARHGVKVELRPARERGTIADVTLPSGVLVPRALSGRTSGGPIAGTRDLNVGTPSSGQYQPLALESGPAGPSFQPAGADVGSNGGFSNWGTFTPPDAGGLGAALSGTGAGQVSGPPFGIGPTSGTPYGAGNRGLPAWSDLTGVNGSDLHPPTVRPPGSDPLPQRRSGDSWTPGGSPVGFADGAGPGQPGGFEPPLPRQRPSGFEPPSTEVPAPPAGGGTTPPIVPAPISPPAWPPVVPADDAPATGEQGTPAVPEALSAALDMTAEIPRVRMDWEPAEGDAETAYDGGASPTGRGGEAPRRFADETMELPIFRELESAWFRSRRTTPPADPSRFPAGDRGTVDTDNGHAPAVTEEAAPVQDTEATPVAATAGSPPVEVEPAWESPADEGWRAAAALERQQDFTVTETGLPKRVPMSQLVPGGVDRNSVVANRRSPEAVRGLLSAYHRGVQRGRGQPKSPDSNGPEPTTTGPQNFQAGKEQEA
jgi:signal transduction histidine kinase